MRDKILDTFSDTVSNFLYYDRKEDEELKVWDIEQFLVNNTDMIKELVDKFELQLRESMQEYQ